MGTPPNVGILTAREDYALGTKLAERLTVLCRRGEIALVQLRMAEGSYFQFAHPASIIVVMLDASSSILMHMRQMRGEMRESLGRYRAASPGLLDQIPQPPKELHYLLVLLRPSSPPDLGGDAEEHWTVLPADGTPLLGRPDRAVVWTALADHIAELAAEVRGSAEDERPSPNVDAALRTGVAANGETYPLPFSRDGAFVGRALELDAIHRHLQSGQIVSLRPAIACGGTGAGVTSLANEYVHRHAASYPRGVFWARQRSRRDRFVDPYESHHALAIFGTPGDAIAASESFSSLIGHPWQTPPRPFTGAGALLVVEGGDERVDRASFAMLPCAVLVILGLHDLSTPDPVIDVGPLIETEFVEGIVTVAGCDREAAASLVRALGGLPISLRIAACHLRAYPGLSADDYIERLGLEDGASSDEALEAVVRLAVASLDGTQAGTVLRVWSLLDPYEPVPAARLALLSDLVQDEEAGHAAVAEALSVLVDRGLVRRLTDGTATLHRRIAPLVRATIAAPEAFGQECAARLAERLLDVERLARELMSRGTKSVFNDLRSAISLRDWRDYKAEVGDKLSALVEALHRTTPIERDRPLSFAAVLQQLGLDDQPFDRTPVARLRAAARPSSAMKMMDRAVEALAKVRTPYLARRSTARPIPVFPSRVDRTRASISADGSVALMTDAESQVVLLDARSGEVLREVPVTPKGRVPRVALAADGRIAAVVDEDRTTVELWDPSKGRIFDTIPLGSGGAGFEAMSISSNGRFVAGMLQTGKVLLIDLHEPGKIRTQSLPPAMRAWQAGESSPVVSEDGRHVIRAVKGEMLWVWDVERDTASFRKQPPEVTKRGMWRSHMREDVDGAITPDGRRAFTASGMGRLLSWDLSAGGSVHTVTTFEGEPKGLCCNAEGTRVALLLHIDPRDHHCSMRWSWGALRVLDVASGALVAEVLPHHLSSEQLAGSADGRTFLLPGDGPCFVDLMNAPEAHG